LTDGEIHIAEGNIEVDTVTDETSYVKRNKDTASSAVIEIEVTHTGDSGSGLLIDHKGTGNAKALEITHAGDYASIDISASAAREGNVINIPMADQLAQTAIDISGAATGSVGEGIVHIDITGVMAGSGFQVDSTGANLVTSHLFHGISAGNQAAANAGAVARFEETGSAQATTYAVYIASTSNEALHVDTGAVQFDEAVTLGVDDTGADFKAFGATASKYMIWDESADTLILTDDTYLEIGGTPGSADGVTFDFDGADLDIDAVTADDNIVFGSDVDTNVIFHTTAGAGLTLDHGANTVTFSATLDAVFTGGATAGDGLVIPNGTDAPAGTTTGSIYYESDLNKLWIYDGAGWLGVTVA